jgi:beta-galactosidase
MEQTTSRVNWREVNVAKAPGQMRLWSFQAMARGADGIMFFQWRQSRAGAEKFHSAMVPHGPVESSPVWQDVKRLGGELRKLDEVVGSRVRADVAIVFDWGSWWALELPSKPSTRLRQMDQLVAFYRPMYEANVTVDFARPTDDLSGYRVVLAPSLYMVTDEAAANLESFVAGGGTLVMAFFSGIVDAYDQVRLGGYPQPFQSLLGLKVIDFRPLSDGEAIALQFADGTLARGETWSEIIEPSGAEVVATFSGAELGGRPAITSHQSGSGTAFYMGTRPDTAAMARVLQIALSQAGVAPAAQTPQGVEVVRRMAGKKPVLFLLNHRDVAVDVPIVAAGENLIDGAPVHPGLMRIEPRGVAIIREGW